jgi:hypothetical protein
VFKREILVANPKNRFENSRFGIELEDERGAGESYAIVYARLAEEGNKILAQQICERVHGAQLHSFDRLMNEVREQYGL